MISKRDCLTRRQRETLKKAFLNANNAILAGWVLTRFVEQRVFERADFLWAGGLYVLTIVLALWVHR